MDPQSPGGIMNSNPAEITLPRALTAADAVLAELLTRGGFDQWWHREIPAADIREEIRWAIARVLTTSDAVPVTAELAGTPDLDVDHRLRVEALQAAAHWHIGSTYADEDAGPQVVVETARTFEAYLRGDR
jgi:hypothetical protein